MKNNSSKNKLENYFRRRFNDSEKVNTPMGWNEPSDNVWERIQNGLKKEEQPQRKFLYWNWVAVAASIMFLISVLQLYYANQYIKILTEQLKENEEIIQKIQADLQALNHVARKQGISGTAKDHSLNTNKQLVKPTLLNNNPKTFKGKTAFNYVNADESQFKSTLSASVSPKNKLGETSLKEVNRHINLLEKSNNESNPSSLKGKTDVSKNVPLLNRQILPVASLSKLSPKIKSFNLSIIPAVKKKPRMYLSADFAPVQTIAKNKGFQFGIHDFFPKKEVQRTANALGFQVGLKWNNGWSLESGLRHTVINSTTNHSRMIAYQALQERLTNNGYYRSNISLQLGSSSGTFDTNVSLARASSISVETNTKISLDIEYATKRTLLDIPIVLRKEWKLGALSLSAKSGLIYRQLLHKSFELQTLKLNDIRFNSVVTAFQERRNNTIKNGSHMHYLVGFGCEYRLKPSLSAYLEPTFTRSIQPVNGQNGANIFIQSKMVNVGFRFIL